MPRASIKPKNAIKNKVKTNNKRAAKGKTITAAGVKAKRHLAIIAGLGCCGLGLALFGAIILTDRLSSYTPSASTEIAPVSVSEHTTSTVPLVISDISVTYQEGTTVIISYITNQNASGEIEYWASDYSDSNKLSNNEMAPIQFFTITGADIAKPYNYRIRAKDVNGNVAVSDPGTFCLTGIKDGAHAPDFTLQSIDGKSVTLSSYLGKPVMMYFWLWSCNDCKGKLPILQEAHTKLSPDEMTIITIHPAEDEAFLRSFVASKKLSFDVLIDQQKVVQKLYGIDELPAVYFIDNYGIIRKVNVHFSTVEELEEVFTKAISAKN